MNISASTPLILLLNGKILKYELVSNSFSGAAEPRRRFNEELFDPNHSALAFPAWGKHGLIWGALRNPHE
jgi:hypothetical protein